MAAAPAFPDGCQLVVVCGALVSERELVCARLTSHGLPLWGGRAFLPSVGSLWMTQLHFSSKAERPSAHLFLNLSASPAPKVLLRNLRALLAAEGQARVTATDVVVAASDGASLLQAERCAEALAELFRPPPDGALRARLRWRAGSHWKHDEEAPEAFGVRRAAPLLPREALKIERDEILLLASLVDRAKAARQPWPPWLRAYAQAQGGLRGAAAEVAALAEEAAFRCLGRRFRCLQYGSRKTGAATESSDADLTLVDEELWDVDAAEDEKLRAFLAGALSLAGHRAARIQSGRVPVVSVDVGGDDQASLDPCGPFFVPAARGASRVEISMRNFLALRNSELLAAYMDASPEYRALAVRLKDWARARGMAGAVAGWMSNYGLAVMALFFMQTAEVGDCRLPNLQFCEDAAAAADAADAWVLDCRRRAWAGAFRRPVASQGRPATTERTDDLLCALFMYFGNFDWRHDAVSPAALRPAASRVSRREASSHAAQCLRGADRRTQPELRVLLFDEQCVQCPLERSRNLAGHVAPERWAAMLAAMKEDGLRLLLARALRERLKSQKEVAYPLTL